MLSLVSEIFNIFTFYFEMFLFPIKTPLYAGRSFKQRQDAEDCDA